MKAVATNSSANSIDHLVDLDIAAPTPKPRDLLVRIEAVSVNQIDIKMRSASPCADGSPRILGWDAAGVVVATGTDVRLFKPGDRVFYAGSIMRPGTNAELQVVDERIVGNMPRTSSFDAAAALPLTAITAWEALFERLRIPPEGLASEKTILIIGAAGGVGSMALQLAKTVSKLVVVATASRTVSIDWCRSLGADLVVDHTAELRPQLAEAGVKEVDYILCLSDTDYYFSAMANLIAPHGHICATVESSASLPMNELRAKSVSFSWEGMFTRSLYSTHDMIEQHHILNRIAALIDTGAVRTTLQQVLGIINANNLRQAHMMLETRRSIGKIVLSGFE
jgi:NADPH2:quinone reductase